MTDPQASGQPAYPPPRISISDRLGTRGLRRPEPRLGVSLAGVGIGLAVLGVIVWGGDYLVGGSTRGGGADSHRILGIVLSLAVVSAGYVLVMTRRHGPLATAGVVSSALGVPVLIGFLSFDAGHVLTSGLPFSLDAIVVVSIVVWTLTYLFVPGARGHAFYLGLAAALLWIYVLDKAEPKVFSAQALVESVNPFGTGHSSAPDWATVSILSLLIGLAYYAAAFALDRSGHLGIGVAFAASAFLATASGVAAAGPDLHAAGDGLLLIALGLVIGALAARSGRRFTTWVWAGAVGLGVLLIVEKVADGNAAGGGIALIACGVAVVVAGQALTILLGERSDAISSPTPTPPGPSGALH